MQHKMYSQHAHEGERAPPMATGYNTGVQACCPQRSMACLSQYHCRAMHWPCRHSVLLHRPRERCGAYQSESYAEFLMITDYCSAERPPHHGSATVQLDPAAQLHELHRPGAQRRRPGGLPQNALPARQHHAGAGHRAAALDLPGRALQPAHPCAQWVSAAVTESSNTSFCDVHGR